MYRTESANQSTFAVKVKTFTMLYAALVNKTGRMMRIGKGRATCNHNVILDQNGERVR